MAAKIKLLSKIVSFIINNQKRKYILLIKEYINRVIKQEKVPFFISKDFKNVSFLVYFRIDNK